MNIGQSICHHVGEKDMKADPNAVGKWLHYRLGHGRPWDGRVIASIINSLLGPAGVGDIECILTQLALAYAAELEDGRWPGSPEPERPSTANPRSRGKPAGRRRSRRK